MVPNGLTWSSHYNVVLSAREDTLALTSWAAFTNPTSRAYTEARVTLVSEPPKVDLSLTLPVSC